MTEAVYVDTSALVKLIAAEAESTELLEFLAVRATRIASAIVIVELGRALGRRPDVDASRSFLVLDRLVLVDTDRIRRLRNDLVINLDRDSLGETVLFDLVIGPFLMTGCLAHCDLL